MFPSSRRISFHASLIAGVFLVLMAGITPSNALAQETHAASAPDRAHMEDVLRGLNRGRPVGQVAVSPDGKRLAWIQMGREGAEIRVAPLDDLNKSERITAAAKPEQHCHENDVAWSPDGKALAFFSDCAKLGEQTDLYVAPLDGGAARRVTELKGLAHELAFSPDGSKLAFLYVEGATRPAGALAAMKPPSGVIGEDGVEIQRVGVADVDVAKPVAPVQPTPANLHVYEFDWSPDSKGLAYVAANPPGENNWWVAKLYTQPLDGAPTAILAPAEVAGALHGLQIAVPRWSPDGKAIAFIGGLMSDQGSTGGDVWMISATGGEPVDLTVNRPTSPAWIEWDGNERIYVSELAGGNAQLVLLGIEDGAGHEGQKASFGKSVYSIPGSVGDGRMALSVSSSADHSIFVFHASSFDHATEIYEARAGETTAKGSDGVTQLSHFNDGVEPAWGKSESLEWKSDQFNVQGWLLLPKDYDPAKKYPMIVEVHGGPAAAAEARWGGGGGLSATAFSALGYFVLQPNPRGSYGQGEEFTKANRKDFGYGDLRDIVAGVDAVVAKYPVDPNRVGITGWSYGGFMTMFAVTQTGRFKAAVSGAGLSNWQSYYGENSIDQWMIPYFGASVYDDPAVYAKSSAINFIKQAHTPTLVVVGDRDGECPAPQSYEFWHALRDEHVTTQLVVYPNEGHGFVDPAHRRDVMERAVEWFEHYMPAGQ
ncbi:MAG: S9 family peptidase [Terracidiphilus sp.]|jgi:dipeptidyl aminopeptidase/acylaminoacyl peptidase